MARKFVITGGPCTGKTSLINELKKEFQVVNEAARTVYEEREWKIDEQDFQHAVFERQLDNEEENKGHEGVIFFDRGLPDSLAYYRFYNFEITNEMIDLCEDAGYEVVFLLDFVPFEDDGVRIENKEEAKEIHSLIREAYEEKGYRVVRVPLMSIKERADYVKKFVE